MTTGTKIKPTHSQQQVIDYAGTAPALVVAGAGSGKTTTMADRVARITSDYYRAKSAGESTGVAPHEILGLTFTRKATKELRDKINSKLNPQNQDAVFGAGLNQPTISTYNAFASRVFQENALVVGREPDAILLTEPGAWELAYEVVISSKLPLEILQSAASTIVSAVLNVAHGMREHGVSITAIEQALAVFPDSQQADDDLAHVVSSNKDLARLAKVRAGLPLIAQLAQEFERKKRELGYIEYSDQVALALEAIEKQPKIVDEYKAQYKVILLDEYQDTSVPQAKFLSALFAGQQVMAVGDPIQAIYGWRGASADAFAKFGEYFGGPQRQVKNFTLLTSWRNDIKILDVANQIADPSTQDSQQADQTRQTLPKQKVEKLEPRTPRTDEDGNTEDITGEVTVKWLPDMITEADEVAAWFKANLGAKTTAALLSRTKSSMAIYCDALERAGVPFVELGATGVLASPEVVDILSALAVIHDMTAGAELIRLLAGAKWRIGIADLEQLRVLAQRLRHSSVHDVSEEARSGQDSSFDIDTSVTILDALDEFAWADLDGSWFEGFSDAAKSRLKDAALTFQQLRRGISRDVVSTIKDVVTALGIDIELYANPGVKHPMANIDALVDYAQGYSQAVPQPTIAGLLQWLARLKNDSEFEVVKEEPERGVVQIMTVHAAKGLEWDIVAVPSLYKGGFPTKNKKPYGWIGIDEVPYSVRADKDSLPVLKMHTLEGTSKPEIKEYLEPVAEFKDSVIRHNLSEERRVAYVAVTRARHKLLMSGSVYKPSTSGKPTQYEPSDFIKDAATALGLSEDVFSIDSEAVRPRNADSESQWPFDPLGMRREQVEQAAQAVREAQPDTDSDTVTDADSDVLRELIAEYVAADKPRATPSVYRLSSSGVHELLGDPARAEEVVNNYLRPIPTQPFTASVLGTRFHAWVEAYYQRSGTTALLDFDKLGDEDTAISGSLSETEAQRLAAFQDTFLASRYAKMIPVAVEEEFTATIGDKRLSAKLDAVFVDADADADADADTTVADPATSTSGKILIVDWKTGKAPKTAAEKQSRVVQLEIYRAIYAKAKHIDIRNIRATLYYIADDYEYTPESLRDEQELAEVLATVPIETRL